jgi:hypothetical protein
MSGRQRRPNDVSTSNIYAGLNYPMIVACLTCLVGVFLLPETHGRRKREPS